VDDAKAEAKKLVAKCKCETKKLLTETMEKMNKEAQDANTKAWNKAYHMECVLDGKTTNNCNVPALPTVQPVPFADGVEDACSAKVPAGMVGFVGIDTGNPVWQCGTNNGQQFQLAKLHIGKRMPSVADWKRCQQAGDGWVALCDYKNSCNSGWVQAQGIQTVWPNDCSIHWHNSVMPDQLRHEGGSPIGRNGHRGWYTRGQNDAYSLRYTSGVRSDGHHAASTPPRSSWTNAADDNYIMCIRPKNGCAKGSCGFS